MDVSNSWILWRIVNWIPLLLSLTVHEFAHAWSAWKLGDDTAEREGRLTLNPLAHIDPVGTLILPLMGIPFGWARPVPVNPVRFRRDVTMRMGMVLTAAAGPLSNVLIAIGCTILLLGATALHLGTTPQAMSLLMLLETTIYLNVILALFNLLPIPPLDGSRVVDGLLPDRYRPAWERFLQVGTYALFGVIILPRMLGFSLFGGPIHLVQYLIDLLKNLVV